MRALLVLYLVSHANYNPQEAFILYTLYISFVKLGAGLSGCIIDRYLEYKKGVIIGGVFIAAGHIFLSCSSMRPLFYLGLGSIIWGSALFRVSLHSLVGLLHDKNDPSRVKAFSLLYIRTNIGAFIAAVLCGIVAHTFGWHTGFSLAALGMLFGLILFIYKISLLENLEPPKDNAISFVCGLGLLSTIVIAFALSNYEILYSITLPLGVVALCYLLILLKRKVEKPLFLKLLGALTLLIAFTVAEELWGSLLMFFSENHVARSLFGYEIPSPAIAATNPLTIILLGPLLAKKSFSFIAKLSMAFLLLSSAFFILFGISKIPSPSFVFLMVGLMAIALGEVLLTPSVLAFASQCAPKNSLGLMMGTTTLTFAIGSLLSGEVAKASISPDTTFLAIGICALSIFLLLVSLSYLKKQDLIQANGVSKK